MARQGSKDRGIYERTIICPECGGKCAACKGTRQTCAACPCASCKACKRTGSKGTGEWWALYYEQGQRHREKGPTKAAARAIYEARRTDIRKARFDPESVGRRNRPRLREVIKSYLAESKATKRSWKDDTRYGQVWTELLGERYLDDIKPADVEAWRRGKLADGASPATVNRHVSFLKRVFNIAIRDERCTANPAARVKKLAENNARTRYLLQDEELRLREALTERWWQFVVVLMLTGMRMGEVLSLRWERIDFGAGVITVPRSKHGEKRHVPINSDVRDILHKLPSRGVSPWVYPGADRLRHMAYSTFRNVWLRAIEKAGLSDLRPHDLRHTFASRLVMAGTDLRTVQELLGHKTITMTERYSHLSPRHLAEAVERLKLPGVSSDLN